MYGSIDTGKIVETLLRNIPGTFVRDHTANGGFYDVMRGQLGLYDASKNTTEQWPAETLFSFLPGQTPRPHLYAGVRLVRPGYQKQLRELAGKVSPNQHRRILKQLGINHLTA